MHAMTLRLSPGDDLRAALDHAFRTRALSAAFVLQGIGSLSVARLRYAGRDEAAELHGDFEILSLAGTLSAQGPHLHMSVSDADGRVCGGHVTPGCIVRTTAEIVVANLPGERYTREHDAATGFAELVIRAA
ncbi:DNA-binding protein [Caballeronia turbans]|jgi:predicted DNA-binding protein with PD1-like motif|uniref:PPC domain-containing DNA-binding protein n=1 Tax=unclassified Caballeronia TaxID=2646786 RepID=UPI00074CB81F|nr:MULTISPECIES: PPC domain-containing DNA-binding protein [unclassified Caballeronia]SAL12961.1 DNA-binding protein [Caballeronia turbans]